MTSADSLRFAIYARVSTEAQEAGGESLSTQVKQMRRWVTSIGGTVAKEYQVQESAMPGQERPSLRRLFSDASMGLFDAVMVVALDRLSRDTGKNTVIETNLRTFGLRLFEKATESNLYTPEGKLTRQMQSVIGEFTVNRLKWAAAASRLERAKRGWPHGEKVPYGRRLLTATDRRASEAVWHLDPEAQTRVARMYHLYIDRGVTFAKVGAELGMNPETIRRILVEQSGSEWVRHFTDPATGQKVEVRTAIPALLDAAQQGRIRDRAKQNQLERAGWTKRSREYPLSGFVRPD